MKRFAITSKDNINQWFRSCKEIQQPYIIVTKQGDDAIVSWDYTHFEKEIEYVIRNKSSEIGIRLAAVSMRYSNENSIIEGSALVGEIKGVNFRKALILADKIFELISQYSSKFSPSQKETVNFISKT